MTFKNHQQDSEIEESLQNEPNEEIQNFKSVQWMAQYIQILQNV